MKELIDNADALANYPEQALTIGERYQLPPSRALVLDDMPRD